MIGIADAPTEPDWDTPEPLTCECGGDVVQGDHPDYEGWICVECGSLVHEPEDERDYDWDSAREAREDR